MNGMMTFLISYRNGFFPFPYRKYMHKHKLIFIHIPRTGGTSVLKFMTGRMSGRDHSPWFQYRISCSWAFEHYFKFAIVRNPWDRFVSLYKYFKKGGNGDDYDRYVKNYIDGYNGFNDFVVNGFTELFKKNMVMFMPQTYFICNLKNELMVDEVLRFENLEIDIKKVSCFKNKKFEKTNQSFNKNYIEFYNQETIEIVRELYSNDINTLKYSFR